MTPAQLTIGALNGHNSMPAFRKMIRRKYDALALSEAHRLMKPLGSLGRYRMEVGTPGRDKRRGVLDGPVLIRRDRTSLGSVALQVSELVKAYERIAPDRWINGALFDHPLATQLDAAGVALLSFHPNAGMQLRNADREDHPLVREYSESVRSLARMVRWLSREGFVPFVAGDYNLPKSAAVPWSPYGALEEIGFSSMSEGVDALSYPFRLVEPVGGLQVTSRTRIGSDHPAIAATFRPVLASDHGTR